MQEGKNSDRFQVREWMSEKNGAILFEISLFFPSATIG